MSVAARPDSGQAEPATASRDEADPLAAFTGEQVRRLTGLSEHQLRSWDTTGDFPGGGRESAHRTPRDRVYRFCDVVGLRTIAILHKEHHVPRRAVEHLGRWLKEHEAAPWSELRLFVAGQEVYSEDPRTRAECVDGQRVVVIELGEIEAEMRAGALRLRERAPEQIGKITRHRDVLSNAWVLDGTRVPTSAVWTFHRAGHGVETILAAYPRLTRLDIEKAIEFEQRRRGHSAG